MPFTVLDILIPYLSIQKWRDRGIQWVEDILKKRLPKPFPEIIGQYDIPPTKLYSYILITIFMGNYPIPMIKLPPLIQTYYGSPTSCLKGISLFYNTLQCKTTFCKSRPLLKWEEDLQNTYTPAQWLQAFKFTHGISHSTNH